MTTVPGFTPRINTIALPQTIFNANALKPSARLVLLTDTLALHKAASSAYLPDGKPKTRLPLSQHFSPFAPDYNKDGDNAFTKVANAFAAMGQSEWFSFGTARAVSLNSREQFDGYFANRMVPLRFVFDAALVDSVTGDLPSSPAEAVRSEHLTLLNNNVLIEALRLGLISFAGASIFVGGLLQRIEHAEALVQASLEKSAREHQKLSNNASLFLGALYFTLSPWLIHHFGFPSDLKTILLQTLVLGGATKFLLQHFLQRQAEQTGQSTLMEHADLCERTRSELLAMHRINEITGTYRESPGLMLNNRSALDLDPQYYHQEKESDEILVLGGLNLVN